MFSKHLLNLLKFSFKKKAVFSECVYNIKALARIRRINTYEMVLGHSEKTKRDKRDRCNDLFSL